MLLLTTQLMSQNWIIDREMQALIRLIIRRIDDILYAESIWDAACTRFSVIILLDDSSQ